MSKSRNYYRRMWYKLQAKKAIKKAVEFQQLIDSYKACNSVDNSLRLRCSSLVNINTKPLVRYGESVRAHWFNTDTVKAIYEPYKNHRVILVKKQSEIDAEIVKTRNKKVVSKEDNFTIHKAMSIVDRCPILYDKNKKPNNYSIRAVG